MKVGIVLDNPKRDLGGVLLMAYQFVKRGVEAYVLPMYQQGCDLPLLGLDGVIVNFARPQNEALLHSYKEMGVTVFVLDTEGGNTSRAGANAPDRWARSLRESGMARYIDYYLFWGPALQEAFREHSGLDPARLVVTGCPRYDFCAEPWRRTLTHPRSDFVLVNTNFTAINPLFSRGESELESLKKTGWQEDYVKSLLAELRVVFESYLDALHALARRCPGQTFLIRAHPFEKEEVYIHQFEGLPNVHVDSSGDVLNVVQACRCVVHLNCATAIEANLLGKVPVSLEFLNTDRLKSHSTLPSLVSHPAQSLEEVVHLLADPVALERSRPRPETLRTHVEPWFYLNDGKAAARVAETVAGALAGRRSPRRWHLMRSIRGSRPRPTLLQTAQGGLSNLLGSRAVAWLRTRMEPARAGKYVPVHAVKALLERLNRCEEGGLTFDVRHARHPLSGSPLASIRIKGASARVQGEASALNKETATAA